MVRAKFRVDAIEHTVQNTEFLSTVRLNPVYSSDPNSENGKFWKWSPCGHISLSTINPEAAKQFELGKEYYIDFSLAEPETSPAGHGG